MSDLIDDISIPSSSDNDSIGDLIIDQMSISEIADYIDRNCHDFSNTPWSGELQFPSIINGETDTMTNILQSVDPKQRKKTKIET